MVLRNLDRPRVYFYLGIMFHNVSRRTALHHTATVTTHFLCRAKGRYNGQFISWQKGKLSQDLHDCGGQSVLTGSNSGRESLEIFSDNDIWHSPENNKILLGSPKRQVASKDMGMRDCEGTHECVQWVRIPPGVSRVQNSLIYRGTQCLQLNLFSAAAYILRFFL